MFKPKQSILTLISMVFSLSAATALATPTVVTNVNGYTLSTSEGGSTTIPPKWRSFKTLVFEHGKVVEIGDDTIGKKYPDGKVIDGQGHTLLPGLIDAHGHVLGLGFGRLNVDVRSLKSATDTALAVQRYAKQHPELSWIKGRGWNQELWPSRQFPNAKDLDEYVTDRPVWLRRVDGHAGWANRKALAYAGINKDTLDPAGGLIIRDAKGEPTGVLVDNAMDLLESRLPQATVAERQSALDIATQHLLSLGLTSVHDAGIGGDVYQLYQQNVKNNRLELRIYAMLASTEPQLLALLQQGRFKDDKDMLSMRSVKLSVDGALGSRGAALLSPYSDRAEQQGLMLASTAQLDLLFEQVLKHQFQLNVHAIGDKGNRVVLDYFEKSFKEIGDQGLRHRIEHAQVVALADIPRFKTLNILPSMQPTHATSDMNMAQDRVGKERLKGAYAWQKFLQQGSRIASGSDFPVELANPFYGIHAAVTRQNRQNQPVGGWVPEEAMTVAQALTSFTLDAAYAAHQDNIIGSLEPGKWADFIMIDQDPFSIAPAQLWQTKVLQTWVAGQMKHQSATAK
ncbi:MAG: putative amidohydrolase YtcJ [Phenylobacterium sp.]|jgi:predicted amidohydrolase YtcJ